MANLTATKSLTTLMQEASETNEHSLKRTLGPVNLIMLGIGAIIGAGLFVRTAAAIADRSGPSVTLAFIVAGVRLRLCRTLLRRIRFHDPGCGECLHLFLLHHGRVGGLDYRLGFGVGVRGRCSDGLHRLERILQPRARLVWSADSISMESLSSGAHGGAAGNYQSSGIVHFAGAVSPAHKRDERVCAGERFHRGPKSGDRAFGDQYRLGLHQSSESHSVHSGANDLCDSSRALLTTTVAYWEFSARRELYSSLISVLTRYLPQLRKQRIRSVTCQSASWVRW